ncbi:MAG TPA: hypothetical protein PLP33_27810, partial [Leptospiraceae bacterium]|nr:hypothetical protein [Leptospiraceae bacterium]
MALVPAVIVSTSKFIASVTVDAEAKDKVLPCNLTALSIDTAPAERFIVLARLKLISVISVPAVYPEWAAAVRVKAVAVPDVTVL